MKLLKSIFHFLGSVYLAIALIAISALMVVLGTFLESTTDSHLLAAQWTYNHPLFGILLWLFFINILFAALRRWPFKWKHFPFLITHFGLLMIFGGTILKNKIGLQGHLSIWEGSGSQQVILPHTHALQIEKRDKGRIANLSANIPIQINQKHTIYKPKEFPDLSIRVISYCAHVQDKIETWIKGNIAYISGYPPLPVKNWQSTDPLINYTQLHLEKNATLWNVAARHTAQTSDLIHKAYLSNLNLVITSKLNPEKKLTLSLENNLEKPIYFDNGILRIFLSISYSAINAFENPHLTIQWQQSDRKEKEIITIPLQGNYALYNLLQTDSWWGTPRFNLDLERDRPIALLIEDNNNDVHLCMFDCHGRVHADAFCQSSLNNLIVYDEGFGGYALQTRLPYPQFPSRRIEKEKADSKILALQIQQAANNSINLSPPLDLFKKACEKAQVNFADTFIEFLTVWQQSYRLLFPDMEINSPLKQVLVNINWQDANTLDRQACQWTCLLFNRLEYPLQTGVDIIEYLESNRWPLVMELKKDRQPIKQAEFLTKLSQQIFSISSQLPHPGTDINLTPVENAKLLSAYFKAYDIDYRILNHLLEEGEEDFSKLLSLHNENFDPTKKSGSLIETPLTIRYIPQEAPKKIEDRHSCILVEIKMGSETERLALAYQTANLGLKWPIFHGRYVIRFQPELVEIPYRVRLRQAREIHYPHTQQPYSYESDILIAQQEEIPLAKTLSMNQVHETWDGYRFYLAGMQSASPQGLKRVQIVVNHDPAKYLLTYPGAVIVFMGIILLFWLRPYRT